MNIKIDDFIIFDEFIKILPTFQTLKDATIQKKYYCTKLNSKDLEYELINSLIDAETYNNYIDDIEFCNILKTNLSTCEIIELRKKTNDLAQLTILNILNDSNIEKNEFGIKCIKHCPHCNCKYEGNTNIKYVICGFNELKNKGYDWEGCRRDWCFQCNKKLCKKWDKDMLYNINLRFHNKICCQHFCKKNNISYDDFCKC